ncbi:hypothetical protein CVT24_007655 [Panaeolus cyanescens]|uniref:Mucoidy inhibitor A n=1 Tax=Panaeolus cyanescens TaxID=181874 RepID=A0A409W9Q6_9AGAR|nr:hypothetical protein CVT24_007655 [Panaeolus cyanescens]
MVDVPIVTVTPPLSTTSRAGTPPPMITTPPSDKRHTVEVTSVKDSKIISVNVYSGHAEVTRLLKVKVQAGHNSLKIHGLPGAMDQESFRVEGRSSVVIHDVSLSRMPRPCSPDASPRLEELLALQRRVEREFERVHRVSTALETYFESVSAQYLDINTLDAVLHAYESTAAELDEKIEELERRKCGLQKEIEQEHVTILTERKSYNDKLNMRASIDLFSEIDGDVKVVIIYAVTNVEWTPHYDIRVDMQTEEEPTVHLTYKASVTQDTGEIWENVPLSLETSKTAFGQKAPNIFPWTIYAHKISHKTSNRDISQRTTGRRAPILEHHAADHERMSLVEGKTRLAETAFSPRGTVNLAFAIQGLSNIPNDGKHHTVVIADLCLGARMSWLCIPKHDTRVYLRANIVNDSAFTLLKGSASVFVDGGFIFKTDIPTVVPDETFECPLGIDTSIRVNYHPCTKKTFHSGFYTKTKCHDFRQPISIFNSKRHAISNLRIVDQFPVSQDSTVTVKHVNPPLTLPALNVESDMKATAISSSSPNSPTAKAFAPVKLSKESDVFAQWWHADEIESGYPVDMASTSSKPESVQSTATEHPPPVEPPHAIELDSIKDSKIISVSVYSARAEITRLFKFNVKTGQNQLHVRNLPQALDQDSFRVEGRGAATIHDVTLSYVPRPPVQTTSATLEELLRSKKRIEKALDRASRSIASLETYLSSVNAQHLDVTKLADVVKNYEETASELDDKVTKLETEKQDVEKKIRTETEKLRSETGEYNEKLNMKASIGIFADFEGEIKIAFIYAVTSASWSAGYDVRVDMQTKEKAVQLDWNDVPLILETANPTFGLSVPTLDQWTLSVYKPVLYPMKSKGGFGRQRSLAMAPSAAMSFSADVQRGYEMPMAEMSSVAYDTAVLHRGADVSSKGAVSATFSVPGLISIPSDGDAHNVTITKLSLDATMSWLCVPKKDNKTHLKAKIKNASEYTLLAGNASVYVDGSFISKTDVPLVSPDESFDCPLGLDPSIRVTYHPRSKKVSQSGFYTKSTNYVYQQRITIHNTKTHAIDGFKVLDQFPVSEDSTITVKHINPALVLPSSEAAATGSISLGTSNNPASIKGVAPVKVAQGVVAQWDGADEVENGDVPIDAVGKEGKVAWICSIPAGSKLGLVLHWEVTTPVRTEVTGL